MTTREKRRDLATLITAAGVYVLLLTVTAVHPTPDRKDVALILYAVGFVLEAVGISTVAVDLRARRRRQRDFYSDAAAIAESNQRARKSAERKEFWQTLIFTTLPAALLRRPMTTTEVFDAAKAGDERLLKMLDEENAQRDDLFLQLVAPPEPDTAAWVGVVMLLLGLCVGTAANIVSVT